MGGAFVTFEGQGGNDDVRLAVVDEVRREDLERVRPPARKRPRRQQAARLLRRHADVAAQGRRQHAQAALIERLGVQRALEPFCRATVEHGRRWRCDDDGWPRTGCGAARAFAGGGGGGEYLVDVVANGTAGAPADAVGVGGQRAQRGVELGEGVVDVDGAATFEPIVPARLVGVVSVLVVPALVVPAFIARRDSGSRRPVGVGNGGGRKGEDGGDQGGVLHANATSASPSGFNRGRGPGTRGGDRRRFP